MKKDSPIRLLDMRTVSGLRSQTIYHALAWAKTPETPDTIVLSQPDSAYACLGFHQDAQQELDLDYCAQHGIPAYRRETGGGTVFIDRGQLFLQWIFQPASLPRKMDERYRLFIKPMTETCGHFGIKAHFHPPNDLHVGSRKISGTGAAAIGTAEVVTGNFLFDFDAAKMASILRTPNEHFRELFQQSMDKFLTTMQRELDPPPDVEEVKKIYSRQCELALNRPLEPGNWTPEEESWLEKLDRKIGSAEWLLSYSKPTSAHRVVKVHAGVWLCRMEKTTPAGSIRATFRTKAGLLDKIFFDCDFEITPASRLQGLENVLRNVPLEETALTEVLESFYELHAVKSPGVEAKDWAAVLLEAKKYIR